MIEKSYQDAELTLRAAAIAHASAVRGSGGSDATQRRLDEACLYMYEMAAKLGRDGHPNDDDHMTTRAVRYLDALNTLAAQVQENGCPGCGCVVKHQEECWLAAMIKG